jgi:fructose-1,6-bisphosphatase II
MRCLGGEIQARLAPLDSGQKERAHKLHITDFNQIYTTIDLAPGSEVLFSATGVTDGKLLRGVRFFGGGYRTSTLMMSLQKGQIRFVDNIRRENPNTPVWFQ